VILGNGNPVPGARYRFRGRSSDRGAVPGWVPEANGLERIVSPEIQCLLFSAAFGAVDPGS